MSQRLQQLLRVGETRIRQYALADWHARPAPDKWSPSEIVGHLIDSALHNWQRFVEIRCGPAPYQVRRYAQDALVTANGYRTAERDQLLALWLQLNQRIAALLPTFGQAERESRVVLPDGEERNLQFLLTDYLDHLEHHLQQLSR